MTTEGLTPEQVKASIVPDSTQINAEDLLTGPMTVTVKGVRRGNREQPINVDLVETDRAYRPCKTMRRVLIAAFSDDPKRWVGQRMTLYCDPNVTWAGVKVGGVRISHLSGLDEPKTFLLTQTRGRKAEVVIMPLPSALSESDEAFIAECKGEIAAAETMEVLKAIGFILKEKTEPVRDALRDVYAKRNRELSEAGADGA
jgi:hypothetical protein